MTRIQLLLISFLTGVIDLIIGPNISAVRTSRTIIGSRLPVAAARKVEPRFEESSVNNSLVIANIGDSVALHCNIWMKQSTTVSWSVDHGRSTMDLLTLDNITFSGDTRFTVVRQNPTNWALVIDGVEARDAGKYICSLETFPKQSLIVYLQVDGPVLEITNSSGGLVYSAGSYLNMECVYLNSSLATTHTTTPHPFFPSYNNKPLPYNVLQWKFNNRTFSLKNRKRVHAYWTGDSVVSTLSIKSAITEDTGNYSCILPNTEEKVTASLLILKGEHSSELRPDTLLASDRGATLRCHHLLLLLLQITLRAKLT